jgi:hypothetical protein
MLCDPEKHSGELAPGESPRIYAARLPRARIFRRAASRPTSRSGILDLEPGNTRTEKIGGDEMRKILITLVAAATLGMTALATSSSAEARWGYGGWGRAGWGYGGWGRGGWGYRGWGYRGWGYGGWGLGGFAAGALAGAAIASTPYYPYAGYYPYAPGYYAYAPTYYVPTYYGYITTFGGGCGCCC